ncbi:hypothetical protein ccbrp13_11370 [Ktedonobacteria bacterium brp13]|nr:hypothetical protein ccbrp13_11370 [Ktedonobacteria bacterium brp13]
MWKQRCHGIYLSFLVIALAGLSACSMPASAVAPPPLVSMQTSSSTPLSSIGSRQASSDNAQSIATIVTTGSDHATSNQQTAPDHSYVFRDADQLSELRHGHKEFTIDLTDGRNSLIIAFYGYSGPGAYTLENRVNGGDVRLTENGQYWDLSLLPTATCDLHILSDDPASEIGIDRMQGTIACRQLPAGPLNKPSFPITISSSAFTLSIIVAS